MPVSTPTGRHRRLSRYHRELDEPRHTLRNPDGRVPGALRPGLQPELVVAAVLSPEGRFLDLEALSADGEHLAGRVVAVEHPRLRRCEPGCVEDWEALVAGRSSIVPHDDDGKRFYLLVVNGASAESQARLTAREADVVQMAARGLTGKRIAYGLGLTPASVSAALGRAAAKMGLRSRTALVAVAAAMFGPRLGPSDVEALTPAERDVLELLRRGMSNAEIARLRARSTHTVANQVASILRKTGQPSRRALAAAVAEPAS